MIKVSNLFVYPIKSLGGYECSSCKVTDRGLEFDRRWMLIDENNRFITQREFSPLALLTTKVENGLLIVKHKNESGIKIEIPVGFYTDEVVTARLFDDDVVGNIVSNEADKWFSKILNRQCRLIYMTENSHRLVDEQYAHHSEITSFSDGYPFLLISKASLNDLNTRLESPLPMNRFRPNIVIEGCESFFEDSMKSFLINGINFLGVKLCGRCVVTTINQDTAEKSEQTEPLRTLATYRTIDKKTRFGQNLLHFSTGEISVGDFVELKNEA